MTNRENARAAIHARLLRTLDDVGYVDSTPDGIARESHLDAIVDAVLGANLPPQDAWPGPALDRGTQLEVRGESHGWIQWKGTQVCMDVHCRCGHHGHIDAEFAYFYRCPGCKGVFAIGSTVHLHQMSDAWVASDQAARPHRYAEPIPEDDHQADIADGLVAAPVITEAERADRVLPTGTITVTVLSPLTPGIRDDDDHSGGAA